MRGREEEEGGELEELISVSFLYLPDDVEKTLSKLKIWKNNKLNFKIML